MSLRTCPSLKQYVNKLDEVATEQDIFVHWRGNNQSRTWHISFKQLATTSLHIWPGVISSMSQTRYQHQNPKLLNPAIQSLSSPICSSYGRGRYHMATGTRADATARCWCLGRFHLTDSPSDECGTTTRRPGWEIIWFWLRVGLVAS